MTRYKTPDGEFIQVPREVKARGQDAILEWRDKQPELRPQAEAEPEEEVTDDVSE